MMESEFQKANKNHIKGFGYGKKENPKFWSRFEGKPNLTDKICCDIGCGRGSLAIDMALSGAKKTFGFDIDKDRIDFAKENLKINFPQLADKVEFHCQNFSELEIKEQFDIITSKDAFEHIVDLKGMINAIYLGLNKGGFLYAGFGPLYYSFYGGHQLPKTIPYLHLLYQKKKLCEKRGLNGYTLNYMESLLKDSGLQMEFFKLNQGNRLKYIKPLLKITKIKEYLIHNVYTILRKQ